MAFLQNLFRGREISKLEGLIVSSPAPSLFVRLAQLYDEADEKEKSVAITRAGAEKFPESEQLAQACADVDRLKLDAECRHLRSRIDQYPSPVLYARLAEVYLKLEDPDEAEQVCRQGIRLDPDYGGLWGVIGRVALHRDDLTKAIESLETATSKEQYNYNALMLLAECYLRNGQRTEGRVALEKILDFSPADEQAARWLEEFDQRAEELGREHATQNPAPPPPASASPAPPPAPVTAAAEATTEKQKKSSGVGTSLAVGVKDIRRVEGVRGTLLIDSSGMVIAADMPSGMEEDLAGALITGIARVVSEHAEALTLGVFEEGICDTEKGSLHILKISQMTMGVFASSDTKVGLLQRAVHIFAEQAINSLH